MHGMDAALSPRETSRLFIFYFALLIACVALPRSLAFVPSSFGAIAAIWYFWGRRTLPDMDRGLLYAIGLFLALAAASILWAVEPSYALLRLMKTVPIVLGGLLLLALAQNAMPVANRDRFAFRCAIAGAFATAVIFWEYGSDFMISRIVLHIDPNPAIKPPDSIRSGYLLNRSLVFMVLLYIPLFLMLGLSGLKRREKYGAALILATSLLLALFFTSSQTAQIAAILAVLMIAYPSHRKKARSLLKFAILAAIFAAPFLPPIMYDAFFSTDVSRAEDGIIREASIAHRLEVWNFVAERTLQHPWLGYGVEATRFLRADAIMPNMQTNTVLHPHNAVLQLWIEFGVLGAIAAAGFIWFLFARIDRQPVLMQRYYTLLIVVMLGVLSMGYGLWQAWQVGMIFALSGLSVMISRIYKPVIEP